MRLKVRFAEVNKTALRSFNSQIATKNIHELSDKGDWINSSNTIRSRAASPTA